MTYSVLDIFSGAGGLSCGFKLAGYKIIGAIEQDKWAGETFKYNFKNTLVLVDDIINISPKKLINSFFGVGFLLGGPPCQGYSICRKNSCDPKDPRNSLFSEFVRIASILKPKVVLMENVPNLVNALTESKQSVIKIIHNELERLGYFVYSRVLLAADYGVPQIRKRLFVIGSKTNLKEPFPRRIYGNIQNYDNKPILGFPGETLKPHLVLWDAISDLPDLEAGEGTEIMEYIKVPQNEYQKLLRKGAKKLLNHVAMKHTRRIIERFKVMSWGESVSDVPLEYKPVTRGNNNIISSKTYDQNNRRMHPYKACHTIPASFYANFVHPFKNRNFTAREGARIQSFPDWFMFKGKPTVISHKLLEREGRIEEKYLCQYAQIGNAVPPLLAKAIAENLKKQV
jgi:DNA (cytosine-5)-methyltransferase 1